MMIFDSINATGKPIINIPAMACLTMWNLGGDVSGVDYTQKQTLINAVNENRVAIPSDTEYVCLDIEGFGWGLTIGDWSLLKSRVGDYTAVVDAYKSKYPTKKIGLYNSVCCSAVPLYTAPFTQAQEIEQTCWSNAYNQYINSLCDFVTPSLYMSKSHSIEGWIRHTDWFLTMGRKTGKPNYAWTCPQDINDWEFLPIQKWAVMLAYLANDARVDGIVIWTNPATYKPTWDENAAWWTTLKQYGNIA